MWLKIIADSFSILQQTLTDSSPSVVIDTAALMINAHRSFFFPIWWLSKRIFFFFFGWKERTRLASVIQGRFLSRSPSLVTESFRLIHVAFYFFWCRPVIRFPPEEEKVKDIHNWLIPRSTWSILKEHISTRVLCVCIHAEQPGPYSSMMNDVFLYVIVKSDALGVKNFWTKKSQKKERTEYVPDELWCRSYNLRKTVL